MSRYHSRESRGGVACVGASPWELPHLRELVWRPCYQEWLRCPKSGHGCPGGMELVLELHQEYPRVVKLVMELHHVSEGGKQGEFWDGGACVWALPCEF